MTKYGYTADEILEIARDVEREGVDFYTRAAEVTHHEKCRELFQRLAASEREHELIFTRLQQELKPDASEAQPPIDEAVAAFLEIVARGSVFQHDRLDLRNAADCHGEADILRMAINNELETILYFYGMKSLALNPAADEAIDAVIQEERKHITQLASHHEQFEQQEAPNTP